MGGVSSPVINVVTARPGKRAMTQQPAACGTETRLMSRARYQRIWLSMTWLSQPVVESCFLFDHGRFACQQTRSKLLSVEALLVATDEGGSCEVLVDGLRKGCLSRECLGRYKSAENANPLFRVCRSGKGSGGDNVGAIA